MPRRMSRQDELSDGCSTTKRKARCDCRRPDIQAFDGMSVCLGCGEHVEELRENFKELRLSHEEEHLQFEEVQISSNLQPYIYCQLNNGEFRLIEIEPGDFEDPVICRIYHGVIGEEEYEAISYTWADANGNSDRVSKITVSQSRSFGSQFVSVTANCEAALRRVRRDDASRAIWIDAVCIDQTNIQERGQQVMQMPRIYSNAFRVIVYLGEADDGSDDLMVNLPKLSSCRSWQTRPSKYDVDLPWWKPAPLADDSINLDLGLSGRANTRRLVAYINSFLQRAWFSRVWCLQEVLMANQVLVVCGGKSTNWSNLLLGRLDEALPDGGENAPLILHLPVNAQRKLESLHQLLQRARGSCAATDPRDKVYALLGLVEDCALTGIVADYEISVETLYCQVTKRLLNLYGTLDVIAGAEPGRRNVPRLPSWVTDWSITPALKPVLNLDSLAHPDQSALEPAFWFSRNDRSLHAKGCVLDRILIRSNSPILQKSLHIHDIIEEKFKELESLHSSSHQWLVVMVLILEAGILGPFCVDKSHIDRSYITQLIHNGDFEDALRVYEKSDRNQRHQTKYESGSGQNDHQHKPILGLYLALDEINKRRVRFASILTHLWTLHTDRSSSNKRRKDFIGRVLFITHDGIIGFGPPQLELGDLLCKFVTSSVGYCLRPEMDHYSYIGESVLCTSLDYLTSDALRKKLKFDVPNPLLEVFELW